jgi:hypothetical protein
MRFELVEIGRGRRHRRDPAHDGKRAEAQPSEHDQDGEKDLPPNRVAAPA